MKSLHTRRMTFLSDKVISAIKNAHALQPFHHEALQALFKVYAETCSQEILSLIENSVKKFSFESHLQFLLRHAIISENAQIIKIVMTQIAQQGFHDLFLKTLVETKRMVEEYASICLSVLRLYMELTPNTQINISTYLSLKSRCERNVKQTTHKNFLILSNTEKEVLSDDMQAWEYLTNGNYGKLFEMLKSNTVSSGRVAEIILRAAIVTKKVVYIIPAYELLVSFDKSRSRFYTASVEQCFVAINRYSKEKKLMIGGGNLTSKVWGLPVVLESPVDMQARKLTFES